MSEQTAMLVACGAIGFVVLALGFLLAPWWSRYRVVWRQFNLARFAFTRLGAERLTKNLARKHPHSTFQVWDAWKGEWRP